MRKNDQVKNWFIQKYSEIHTELDILEKEIDYHISNKTDILCNNYKIEDLKKRASEAIDLLNKTREDERRIFNY